MAANKTNFLPSENVFLFAYICTWKYFKRCRKSIIAITFGGRRGMGRCETGARVQVFTVWPFIFPKYLNQVKCKWDIIKNILKPFFINLIRICTQQFIQTHIEPLHLLSLCITSCWQPLLCIYLLNIGKITFVLFILWAFLSGLNKNFFHLIFWN